jgi:hypothetical protein
MSASLPFRQSFPPFDIVGRDGFLPGIEAETAVGPGEELAELPFADELFPAEQSEESVAEEFRERLNTLIRPPRPAGSLCGLRLRLRPKRLQAFGVFRSSRVG